MNDLDEKIKELKKDKKAIKDYLECFYDIEKVKEVFKDNEELKKIEKALRDND